MAQHGIAAPQVDAMELWQAMASLGQHRHPDYWKPEQPERADGSGRHTADRGTVRSSDALIADSADLFAARRAAAAGLAPPPAPEPNRHPGIGAIARRLAGK